MIKILTNPHSLHIPGRGQRKDAVILCDQGTCQRALKLERHHDPQVVADILRQHRPSGGWYAAKRRGVPVTDWKTLCPEHAPAVLKVVD